VARNKRTLTWLTLLGQMVAGGLVLMSDQRSVFAPSVPITVAPKFGDDQVAHSRDWRLATRSAKALTKASHATGRVDSSS
jgi:hypothetical protein